jgi:predicted transcriptional regulator
MNATFKALADESRRKLTQLCGLFDMSRQAVTKHLCLMEAANLVTTICGREKLHYLNPVAY